MKYQLKTKLNKFQYIFLRCNFFCYSFGCKSLLQLALWNCFTLCEKRKKEAILFGKINVCFLSSLLLSFMAITAFYTNGDDFCWFVIDRKLNQQIGWKKRKLFSSFIKSSFRYIWQTSLISFTFFSAWIISKVLYLNWLPQRKMGLTMTK